jgi:uncharacterized protein (TIGR03067 family)
MIRTSLIPALALALLVGPARADAKDDLAKEMKALAGTWEVVKMVHDGVVAPLPPEGSPRVTVKEDGSYAVKAADMALESGVGKIDPAKSPKTLDITPADGPNKGKTLLGIYELKGDELRVCWSEPGKDRPADFTSKEGSGRIFITYKRVK